MEGQKNILLVLFVFAMSWSCLHCAIDKCRGPRYRCAGNRNPCTDPPCNPDLSTVYPGSWNNRYIQCAEGFQCIETTCDVGKIWNQELKECVPKWGYSTPAEDAVDSENRCFGDEFVDHEYDCKTHNPCAPSRCGGGGVAYYPGPWRTQYVHCDADTNLCTEEKCPAPQQFDVSTQLCVLRLPEDLEARRCSGPQHNCGYRNPCAAPSCESGVAAYPGPWRDQWVDCSSGCEVKVCDEGQWFDINDRSCKDKDVAQTAAYGSS